MMTPQNIFHYLHYDLLYQFRKTAYYGNGNKIGFDQSSLIMKILSKSNGVIAIYKDL